MRTAYIALGANLGNPKESLRKAVEKIKDLDGVASVEASGLYSTAPIDSSGPDYLNAVLKAEVSDEISAETLLDRLLDIENQLGRVRPAGVHNPPRVIDCDLLLCGKEESSTPKLVLPHPRMTERAFVLVPLVEVDSSVEIPGKGKAVEFLDSVKDQSIIKLFEARDWL